MAETEQERERDEREQDARRDEDARTITRDRALVRLDETEIKARLVEAFDRFVEVGLACHLIGVKARAAIEYRIALYPDGHDSIPSSQLQEIANEFRLDYVIERDGYGKDGWAIVLYPRW